MKKTITLIGDKSDISCFMTSLYSVRDTSPIYDDIKIEEGEDEITQPLIKDEKIRKAVRAWWDCCQEGIDEKRIYIKDGEFRMGIYRLDLGRYYFFDDKKEGFYTIAELCGEEEE